MLQMSEKQEIDGIMISAIQVQTFKQQFKDIANTIKLFSTIEQQFIKRFRLKNQQNTNKDQFQQFIKAFKQTMKYYNTYNEHIQNTLEKYAFCSKLKRFIKQLYKSKGKIISFFTEQIQLHAVFVRQNQEQYKNSLTKLKNICTTCKQIQNKKNIKTIKQELHFPFQNSFKMYKDINCDDCRQSQLEQNALNFQIQEDSLSGFDISSAQMKLKKIISKNKKNQISALTQIFDMFQKKQQQQFNAVNKLKINEMFYELQNQLQNRSFQIQQYLQDLQLFNEKLMNYNPHLTSTCQPHQQIQPNIVQKELKFNLQKIIKKIYQKINQIIQKRKEQSLSKHVQVNFTQDHVIKDLQKQKKKLNADLRECQQQKQYTITVMKAQLKRFQNELATLTDQKIKIQIIKDQYFSQKQNLFKNNYQLTKIIEQLKKQLDKTGKILFKQKKLQSKSIYQPKAQSDEEQSTLREQLLNQQKIGKQAEIALLYQFEQRQQELLKKLQMKNKKGKKGYFAPRRSKILQVINLQDHNVGSLQKVVSRFSKDHIEAEAEEALNLQNNENVCQIQNQSSNCMQTPEQTQTYERISDRMKQNINQGSLKQQQNNQCYQNLIKKVKKKAKTVTKFNNQKIEQNQIKSNKSISQTSQDVKKQLQELQQLKKFKIMEQNIIKMQSKQIGLNQKNAIKFNLQNKFTSISSNLSFAKQHYANQQKTQEKQNQINMSQNEKAKQIPSIPSITSSNYLDVYSNYQKQNQMEVSREVQTQKIQDLIYNMLYEHQLQKNTFNPHILTFNAFKFGYDQFIHQIINLIQKQQKNPIRKLNMYKGSSFILKKSHNYRFNKKQFSNIFQDQKRYFIPKSHNQNNLANQMSKTTNSYSVYRQDKDLTKTQSNFMFAKTKIGLNSLACKTISDFKSISLDKDKKYFDLKNGQFFTNNKLKTQTFTEDNQIKSQVDKQNIMLQNNKMTQNTKQRNYFILNEDIQKLFLTLEIAQKIQDKKRQKVEIKLLHSIQIRFSTQFLAAIAQIHVLSFKQYELIKKILTCPSQFFTNNPDLNGKNQDSDLKQNINYLIFLHRSCKAKNKLKQLINKKQFNKQVNTNAQNLKQKPIQICSHLKQFIRKIYQLINYLIFDRENNQFNIQHRQSNQLNSEQSKNKITSIQDCNRMFIK